ncbi:AraC family transcriptional regulator [Gordonia terrae]
MTGGNTAEGPPKAAQRRAYAAAWEPMRQHSLLRTTDVTVAETMGGRFLSENHLRLQSSDEFDARIHGVSLGPVSVYYLNYGAELEVVAPPFEDYIAVVLPLTGSMEVDLAGERFDVVAGETGGVLTAERPLRMRWTADYSMLTARIDLASMSILVRSLDPSGDENAVRLESAITQPAALQAIGGATRMIVDVFERLSDGQRPTPLIAAQLRDQLLTAVLLTQPNSHSEALLGPAPAVSHAAVRRAVEIIESSPEQPHTVTSIAKSVGVSTRALHEAFRSDLGGTPAAYLTEVRLERAHRELVTCRDPERTVGDIAMAWGFSNPGRFAAYYRQRYGELPSTVLAAGR